MCGKFTAQAPWAKVPRYAGDDNLVASEFVHRFPGQPAVAAKTLLRTMEGVTWTAAAEPKKPAAEKAVGRTKPCGDEAASEG